MDGNLAPKNEMIREMVIGEKGSRLWDLQVRGSCEAIYGRNLILSFHAIHKLGLLCRVSRAALWFYMDYKTDDQFVNSIFQFERCVVPVLISLFMHITWESSSLTRNHTESSLQAPLPLCLQDLVT